MRSQGGAPGGIGMQNLGPNILTRDGARALKNNKYVGQKRPERSRPCRRFSGKGLLPEQT